MPKHLKLPNGYGSICKLSGNRRNPYAVYPPVKEFNINGSPIRPKAIGYFPSYTKALEALTEYNKRPFNTELRGLTFTEVYEMWSKVKFADQSLSPLTIGQYKGSFGRCSVLHDRVYSELRTEDFQQVLDSPLFKTGTLRLIKSFFSQLGNFALQNDIVTKDYAQFARVNKKDDTKMGTPFTSEEICKIWQNKDQKDAQILLLLIYSGLRISELKRTNIDLQNRVFKGGIKTSAGKNRIVPIHSAIYDIAAEFDQESFVTTSFQNNRIHPFLKKIGISEHTAHDCRHTFSWLCDKYNVDDFSKHLMMGHSLGSDVERATYGHRTLDELREEIEKIKKN